MPAQKHTDDEVLAAVEEHGSQRKAAEALGLDRRTVERRLQRMRRRGWSPEHDLTKPVPDGFHLKGASTLYGPNGEQKLQWVKSGIDHERQREIMEAAVQAMKDDIGRAEPVKRPAAPVIDDLANLHVMTDVHLATLAWSDESGEDYDIDIAENMLYNWFANAIDRAPSAATGILANIGDFLTSDGLVPETPAHKNVIDVDSRFAKIVRVAIRSMRRIVRMMLEKYDHVHLICSDANHDESGEVWLREMFFSFYEDEPRITVDNNPDTYNCYEHGLTSLFFHHGHKRKPADVDSVFAAKYREVFGRTKFSYAHMGHQHHLHVKESSLMIVEQHRTMAAKDAHASRGGYISGRSASVITYSKRFGEVSRLTVSPEMLQ